MKREFTRIAGLFARRALTLRVLLLVQQSRQGLRITMVVPVMTGIEQLTKLYKLVNVLVQDITEIPCVERELMLLKVNATNL